LGVPPKDRKHVQFDSAQVAWLAAEAKRLRMSEAEVIRRLIDKAMGREVA